MTTLTRCSSTPSADTLVNAAGSIRRTRPDSGGRPRAAVEARRRARLDQDRVGGQHVDDDLEVVRIAHLDQRRADRHDGLALLRDPQHASGDGRADVPALAACPVARAGPQQRRAREGELVLGRVAVEARGGEFLRLQLDLAFRALQRLLRGEALAGEAAAALELGLREP